MAGRGVMVPRGPARGLALALLALSAVPLLLVLAGLAVAVAP